MTLDDMKEDGLDAVVIDAGISFLKTYHTRVLGGLLIPPEIRND